MKTLEEIVAEHPLPWILRDDTFYDQDMHTIPTAWDHHALAHAAPEMALAIRALLRGESVHTETLRASLPPELRP